MGISVMAEGETMGVRGTTPGLAARVAERARDREPEGVVILGAGPAGLLAAHAVVLAGRTPLIFSAPATDREDFPPVPAKSAIGGATYLHSPIPDLTSADPDGTVTFDRVGTASGYALKVYGDRFHPTSWSKFDGEHPAWALQPAYNELWQRYGGQIVPQWIDRNLVEDLLDTFPLVISTIPPKHYCHGVHSFPSRDIWIGDWALESVPHNTILYDGLVGAQGGRYRSSRIFGHPSTEYATDEIPSTKKGIKVLPTTCDCFHDDLIRVGRWGKWQPGVLVDHAFQEVFTGMFDQFEGA